jgi:signal transduction histidine kinase/CheY-like chemotaxis protein/ligand-binding sensor domain-containing protein
MGLSRIFWLIFHSLFLLFFSDSYEISAQSGRAKSELPLPTQRVVRSMATGPEGYLWLGTQYGLYRYDGHRYVEYSNAPLNPNRITHNNVLEVLPTKDGKLVLSNNIYAADILDPHTNQLINIDLGLQTTPRGKIRTASRQPNGEVYFITEHNEGFAIFRYEDSDFVKLFEQKERRLTNPDLTIPMSPRFFMAVQSDQTIFLYDQENGLIQYDERGQMISRFTSKSEIGSGKALNFFKQINEREILLAYSDVKGIYKFDILKKTIAIDSRFSQNYHYALGKEDAHGNFLFGVKGGDRQIKAFLILDSSGKLSEIANIDSEASIENFVFGIDFSDYFYAISANGLFQIKTGLRQIKSYQKKKDFSIRGMIEDDHGNLILTTEWHGWYLLDLNTDQVEPINMNALQIKDLNPAQYSRNLLKDKRGDIWGSAYGNPPVTATPDGYLLRYSPDDGRIVVYKNKYRIEALLMSQDGQMYLASNRIFQSFDPSKEEFKDLSSNYGAQTDESVIPNCIIEGKNGLIWIGTDGGLARYDTKDQSIVYYGTDNSIALPFNNRNILSIQEDITGGLWLGAQGAMYFYDPVTNACVTYTQSNGLPDNNICGIIQDKKQNLWISTFNGLSYFDREKDQFRNFYTFDGFNHNEFNRHAFFRSKEGTYYVGGMEGFNSFLPDELLKVQTTYKLLFSEIAYFQSYSDSLIIRTTGLNRLSKVTLPAANRFLQVRFGLNNFSQPEQNSYSVFLEGYDSDWVSQGNIAEVRYNNLPSGNYRLHIRGTGPSGTLSENTLVLDIHVKQFFYKSMWFYLLLFLIGTGLASLWIMRLRTEKIRLTQEVEKRTQQILSDKETIESQAKELEMLDRMKSRFFANISHELRTPLTLILSPLKRILSSSRLEKETIQEHLQLMERNGEVLHYRIEELLELSRLEVGKSSIKQSLIDLEQYLSQIMERFRMIALQKHVELIIDYHVDFRNYVRVDAAKLEKIVSNLLSNALKFTSVGKIELNVLSSVETSKASDQRIIELRVRDTGIGIPPEEVPFIFDRYFQAQNGSQVAEGTGIGLSIVKEFVQIMGGTISVTSQLSVGSTFAIQLPVSLADPQASVSEEEVGYDEIPYEIAEVNKIDPRSNILNDRFTILLVEDNIDLRRFLEDILKVHFNVIPVENGKQAFDFLAHQSGPIQNLLVLSDIMMPEMDGYTLLDLVRSEPNLKHIPFIMLTAKAGGEHRMRALRMGVDDYLLKPFSEEELLVRITNLLSNLQIRQQLRIEDVVILSEGEIGQNWLEHLENLVLNSLTDPQMGMDFLAERMGISRSSLHRRIKAETGLTPNMYIREIRLQEARRLMEGKEVSTVAEAGVKVGLLKRAYFSNLFFERFGRLPSSYFEGSSNSY